LKGEKSFCLNNQLKKKQVSKGFLASILIRMIEKERCHDKGLLKKVHIKAVVDFSTFESK
jgi:hypothetical protein